MGTTQTYLDQSPNKYMTFSAKSMKALVNQSLLESGVFTDQLFEGSNLSIVNNLFAFTFDATVFYLNHTATEGMFTDMQYYEDANRVVKVLNYNPRGFITSMAVLNINVKNAESTSTLSYMLPRYLTLQVGSQNFTLVEDFDFTILNGNKIADDKKVVLHNGSWQAYPDLLVATGIPFETFTLPALNLTDEQNKLYVAHPFIDVYVEENVTDENSGTVAKVVNRWTRVLDLYDSGPIDRQFEIRLNEKKQYEIKFGDNVSGRRLSQKDVIHVIYLKSDGPNGIIAANSIDTTGSSSSTQILGPKVNGLNPDFVTDVLLSSSSNAYMDTGQIQSVIGLKNSEPSTSVVDFESVDEIKAFAPNWFRMQNRLITSQDYEQYILANHFGNNEIKDVTVQSNTEYMREFQQWLHSFGKLNAELLYYSYRYADACDFNNVYIWLKSSHESGAPVSFSSKELVMRSCEQLKSLTSELVIIDPIMVAFTPYYPYSTLPDWSVISQSTFGQDNKIVIVRDKNSMVAIETIRKKVLNAVLDFFNVDNNTLGGNVSIDVLLGRILTIAGVKEVKTVKVGTPEIPQQVFNGLSFGVWTPLILRGDDFRYANGTVGMKTFQFPFLFDESRLLSKIVVESENFKLNNIEY